jgi:hypothetical protein
MALGGNRQKNVAAAGYRSGQFVGYAYRTAEGWRCVFSIGISWSSTTCRSPEEARSCLQFSANAMNIKWFSDIIELENLLRHLPEHLAPPVPSEGLAEAVNPPRLSGTNNWY